TSCSRSPPRVRLVLRRTVTIVHTRTICLITHLIFFSHPATTQIYTLSLHDALPICDRRRPKRSVSRDRAFRRLDRGNPGLTKHRSEEHTSELQSHLNLVCRLLLEKKKKRKTCMRRTWCSPSTDCRRGTTIATPRTH